MSGASIEATLELWASSLRDVKDRMRPLFTQERVAASAGAFLDGLLGNEQRKTGWMRAEAAGDPGPWRQQAILGRGRWEADDLRDIVRGYALETLADDDAVLVFDETGFLKQGKASCGVARQYTGSAGTETPVGGRWRQGAAPLRLGLCGTGRYRCQRVRRKALRALDARPFDPPHHRRSRPVLFLHLGSSWNLDRETGACGGLPLGHRGQLRDGKKRAWP